MDYFDEKSNGITEFKPEDYFTSAKPSTGKSSSQMKRALNEITNVNGGTS